MGHVTALGYMGGEPDRVACALHELRGTLVAPGNATGHGVAHYQDDRLLMNIKPAPLKGPTPLEELVGPVKTRTLLCATHQQDEAGPYKFRLWSGLVVGGNPSEETRAALSRAMPDVLRRNISTADTHGEIAFHHFLSGMGPAALEDPQLDPAVVAGALRATRNILSTGGQPTTLLVTNGRMLVAAGTPGTLSVSLREAILACQRCQAEGTLENFAVRESHRRYRGVVVAVGLKPVPPGFLAVEGGRTVVVGRKLDVSYVDG